MPMLKRKTLRGLGFPAPVFQEHLAIPTVLKPAVPYSCAFQLRSSLLIFMQEKQMGLREEKSSPLCYRKLEMY